MGHEVVAGWYPDPADGDQLRWWDGDRWTAATRDAAREGVPPAGGGSASPDRSVAGPRRPVGAGGAATVHRRRGAVVAGVLAATLLVGSGAGVGLALWLDRPTEPVGSVGGSSVAGGSTTEQAAGVARADGETGGDPDAGRRWSRVPHDEAVLGGPGGQMMWSVAAGGPGLVAVGADFGVGAAAVWTSPDGRAWSRIPHAQAVFGGSADTGVWQEMWSVTPGGPGLVAVGADFGAGAAAVWTSPDGGAWSRVPHDEAVFGGPGEQWLSSVVAGGPGLVAVGADGDGGERVAAVWTSPDGRAWSRVPHDEAVFGGPGEQAMRSVTAGGPGLVAVGYDFGLGAAAVWTSPDGRTWSRLPPDEDVLGGPGGPEMFSVVAGGPGLVAVGSDGDVGQGAAAVWTSPDGGAWSRVPHDEAVFGGPHRAEMFSVAVGGPGLVAVGSDGDDGEAAAAVWTSPDGRVWSRAPHVEEVLGGPGVQAMWSVVGGGPGLAGDGPGLVAVGADGAIGESAAAVWVDG